MEADLTDEAMPARIFDAAEAEFCPVDILINNASSWRQDSFRVGVPDAVGRDPERVTAASVIVYPPVTNTGWVTPEVEAAVDRVATPDEVAEVIALLCTDAAAPVALRNRMEARMRRFLESDGFEQVLEEGRARKAAGGGESR